MFLFEAGRMTSTIKSSGNAILKRSSSPMFAISSCVNCFHFPSTFKILSSACCGKIVGTIHWPVVPSAGGPHEFSGAGSLSSSNSMPWRQSSAISLDEAGRDGTFWMTFPWEMWFSSMASGGSAAGTSVAWSSASKIFRGGRSTLKCFATMWRTSSIPSTLTK